MKYISIFTLLKTRKVDEIIYEKISCSLRRLFVY